MSLHPTWLELNVALQLIAKLYRHAGLAHCCAIPDCGNPACVFLRGLTDDEDDMLDRALALKDAS